MNSLLNVQLDIKERDERLKLLAVSPGSKDYLPKGARHDAILRAGFLRGEATGDNTQASRRKNDSILWDGITQSIFLTAEAPRLRQQLSDAAKNYDWKTTLKIVSEYPDLVNVTRPDGASLYAPLHQAAHGGAPLEVIEQLIEMGAWRTLQNGKGERPLDVAVRQKHKHLYSALEPQYKRRVPLGILSKIQQHFHKVMSGRISGLEHASALRLPEIEPLLEYENAKVWFVVLDMYGEFHYGLKRVASRLGSW